MKSSFLINVRLLVRKPLFWFLTVGVIYILFTAENLTAKRPWVDEGWFAGPALNLATRGTLGTLLLDPAGSNLAILKPGLVLKGINQHTYWVMPLYLLQLAFWGKLFGFSVFSIRVPSILWGGVTLMSVWIIIRRLYPADLNAAILGSAVLAVDFGFVNGATDGRMDMTCLGLGLAGLTAYLILRNRSFEQAVFASNCLAAAGCMTHPHGMFAVITLAVAMIWLDRDRFRVRIGALAAAPYLFAVALWAIYLARAPGDFLTQFSANSAGRVGDLLQPWHSVWDEICIRFMDHYWRSTAPLGKLRIAGLLLSIAATGIIVGAPDLRRSTGCRLLLSLVAIRFLLLSLFANPKFEHYIVHIAPYFAMVVGIAFSYLWKLPSLNLRIASTAALVIYFAAQSSVMVHRALILRPYEHEYRPLIRYLQSETHADDLIAGSAELGFGLGFYNPQLTDDVWLGYWSGKTPTLVVVDQWYYEGVFQGAMKRKVPTPDYFTTEFKRRYRLIKEIGGYKIYRLQQGGLHS